MLNVKEEYFDMLESIFRSYCPDAEIWAYGSRIKNDSHSGSDLDLVVGNFHDTRKSIGELRSLFNDSDIPFLVEIQEFDQLPKLFRK